MKIKLHETKATIAFLQNCSNQFEKDDGKQIAVAVIRKYITTQG